MPPVVEKQGRREPPVRQSLLTVAVDDGVGERVELVPPDDVVEALPRPPRVVERDLPRAREGVGGGNPDEGTLERAALQRAVQQVDRAIVLAGADRDKWLGTAREVGWAAVKKASPQHGAALQKLFAD